MGRSMKQVIAYALLIAAFLLGIQFLGAQEFRSTLTGQVTDPSGAVIGGASVTAVNNATGVAYTGSTSQAGDYFIPYVLPGTYTVTVKASGFKTAVQENVTLRASQSYGLNFKLELGALNQEVTVTGAPPAIETSSGSGGTILSEREVENLPLNGRQVYMLIGTTPGSQFTQEGFGAAGYSGTRGWDVTNAYTIGGSTNSYNQFTLNGTNMTIQTCYEAQCNGTWMVAPNLDAVQEVNVMTTTYDARYGRTGGGTVNMVTKSGTNQLHGDAYDYLENGALNANVFQNNMNGVPVQKTIQNQFGGTFGGPIKKDKIFFFASYEGYREEIPFSNIASVPTLAMRGGDFSQSGYEVFDPSTTVCSVAGGVIGNCPGNAYSRTEFSGDVIPSGDINAVGQALVSLFPKPNINVNSPRNNFIAATPDKYRYDQPMIRVDYSTSDKTRWYSMFEWQTGTEFRNSLGFPSPAETGNINWVRENWVASQDVTHTFSPTLVGDFKLSFSRFWTDTPDGDLTSKVTPASIGLTGMIHAPTTTKQLLPEVYFSELYPGIIGNATTGDVYQNTVLDADFTKTKSRHNIHFGGEYGEYNFANPLSFGHPNGDFTFGTGYTQYNPTARGELSGVVDGNVVGDLLLGYPDSGGMDWNNVIYEGQPAWAIYAQDDFRATKRLSLNIGLRYDVQRGLRERHNFLNAGMCLTCTNPISSNATYQANITNPANVAAWQAATAAIASAAGGSVPTVAPSSPVLGGLVWAGQNGVGRDAYYTDWTNIQPRIGIAYALNEKTVLRGGWGWMYAWGLEGGTFSGYSITTPYTASLNGGITPTNYFDSGTPFQSGLQPPIGSAQGLLSDIGNPVALDFPQRKIPRSTIMSFGIQRELPNHITLDVRYAGNYTRNLRNFLWLNGTLPLSIGQQLQQGHFNANLVSQMDAQVPNPYWGVIPQNTFIGSSPTLPASILELPWNEFGLVGDYVNPSGKNWYDGLEVKVTKRLYGSARGLSFALAYTYSKTMTDDHYLNGWPYQDAKSLYEVAGTDRTHIFTLTGVWDLPMGKGAKFIAPNPSKPLGAIINDWKLNWIFSDATGFPFNPNQGFWYACNTFRPKAGPTFGNWLYIPPSGNPMDCYEPVPGGFPVSGLGNLPDQVSFLRQPYIPNLDLSLEKNIPITESKKLQFRAEAFNFMNTPLFPGPDNNPFDGPPTRQANGAWVGYGTINFFQQNFPRMIQLTLKFLF